MNALSGSRPWQNALEQLAAVAEQRQLGPFPRGAAQLDLGVRGLRNATPHFQK